MPICRPRSDDQHAERDDEADQPEPQDQQAVERADQRADEQAERDRQRRRAAQCRGRCRPAGMTSATASAGREADGGLQRQVELAGDQDHRLGQHQQRQLGLLLQDVDQVVRGAGRPGRRARRRPAARRSPGPARGRAAGPAGCRAAAGAAAPPATGAWRSQSSRLIVRSLPSPRRARGRASRAANSRDDPAVEHHQDPVADAQVVELVGDDEHRRAAVGRVRRRRRAATPWTARPRPAVGLISTSTRGSVGQRPGHARPSAGCRRTGRRPAGPGPAVLMSSSSIMLVGARAARRPGRSTPSRPEPVGDRQGGVLGDRQQRDEALAGAGPAGTNPTPGGERGGHAARPDAAGRRPSTVPASAPAQPDERSRPAPTLPLLPEPARPTISPRPDGEVDVLVRAGQREPAHVEQRPARVGGHGGRSRAARQARSPRRSSPRRAASCGRSATGAVTMWRASRKTVTVWQIS